MEPIYDAGNVTDAHMVKHLLEDAGIAAYIRGEHLQGAFGEIPAGNAIAVCLANADAARARAIVEAWQAAAPGQMADDTDVPVALAAIAPALSPWRHLRALAMLCMGIAIGATLMWAQLRLPSQDQMVDYDDDGVPDAHAYYSGQRLDRVETDRNHDGKTDMIEYFDNRRALSRIDSDDGFDGVLERSDRYSVNQWAGATLDANRDGRPEYLSQAELGVLRQEDWFNADGATIKHVDYRNAAPVAGSFDADHDGRLDTRRSYDALGEIIRSEALVPSGR